MTDNNVQGFIAERLTRDATLARIGDETNKRNGEWLLVHGRRAPTMYSLGLSSRVMPKSR
jgi:hypothetical protein